MFEEVFCHKDIEYFWEYDYKFGTSFLKSLFPNEYYRKYSMTGAGIFNYIRLNGSLYEVKLTKAASMVSNDGKVTSDLNKNKILKVICNNLPDGYSTNSGKFITFKVPLGIAKLEIIKKQKEAD